MSPQVLEFIGLILLALVAYVIWHSRRRPEQQTGRLPNGKRRDVWDEVEGKVTSIAVRGEAVFVNYEFLTPKGSQHSEHRFPLEVSEPYQFVGREAELAHAAERYLRAYPVGCSARVRYNPKRVAESVLARPRSQTASAAVPKTAESHAVS